MSEAWIIPRPAWVLRALAPEVCGLPVSEHPNWPRCAHCRKRFEPVSSQNQKRYCTVLCRRRAQDGRRSTRRKYA